MASAAAALLAAFNGKSVPISGVTNNGGNGSGNPFGVNASGLSANAGAAPQNGAINSASPYNPMAAAQNEVDQSQSAYQNQLSTSRSQLASDLGPASVGGGSTIFGASAQNGAVQNSTPFAQFNDAINGITSRGADATAAQAMGAQTEWNSRIAGLNDSYKTNSANASQALDQTQIGTMLANAQGSFTGQLPTGADPNNPGARAVMLAQKVVQANVPYVYGGNSLTQGVDCSALVQQIYGKLGIQLPRTSTEQAKAGKVVPSLQQALPGDLILEYSPYEQPGHQQFGHVGIYLGNGQVIEAPGTGKNVRVGPIVNMTRIVRPW